MKKTFLGQSNLYCNKYEWNVAEMKLQETAMVWQSRISTGQDPFVILVIDFVIEVNFKCLQVEFEIPVKQISNKPVFAWNDSRWINSGMSLYF